MRVLVDTNVVLDVFLKQEPFLKDSRAIHYLAYSKQIDGVLAAVSMTNIFFLYRKRAKKSPTEAYQEMDKLSAIFKIASVTDTTISTAMALRWKDFEDAVQFISAKENNVDFIITRNKADYQSSDITCMTPTEFIAFLKEKEEAAENNTTV